MRMGNRQSFRRERRESRRSQRGGGTPGIPEIKVIEASPLPVEESVFRVPEPVEAGTEFPEGARDPERAGVPGGPASDDGGDEERPDARSSSGSEGSGTPRGSRSRFIEVMMSSSPQVRRSMAALRGRTPSGSDSDSASLVSFSLDGERAPATLDPLEHQWMMCASDGEWGGLRPLLSAEPGLVLRRDFVTGFTCLHWAAKHGKPELMALLVDFAERSGVPASVDVRSDAGYTPLHVAAMHGHMEVVKLLVGAYGADVEARDHSGRKACQYLTDGASVDIRDIIGAYERSEPEGADRGDGGRWRFSEVLRPGPGGCGCEGGAGGPGERPLRRKSSLGRLKPKLQKLRARTSQIVHSASFHGPEDLGGPGKGPIKLRPKTHLFG